MATARERLLDRHFGVLTARPRHLAYQCVKIANAWLRAGETSRARTYGGLTLATAPWSPRVAAPGLVSALGLSGAARLYALARGLSGRAGPTVRSAQARR